MLHPMKYCSHCGAEVTIRMPLNDNRERWVCRQCKSIHYQNPQVVVGCVAEKDGKVLLCRRAIEPRYGYWTIPAGFLELGESLSDGAARETREEACAEVEIGHMFASVDLIHVGQVHIFFTGKFNGVYGVGEECMDARLFAEHEIPWDEIAFDSGRFALERYFNDRGANNGVYTDQIRQSLYANHANLMAC